MFGITDNMLEDLGKKGIINWGVRPKSNQEYFFIFFLIKTLISRDD